MADKYLHSSDIRERDIDLLVLGELYSSPDFQTHFLKSLGGAIPVDALFQRCEHSIANTLGQSDLEITFLDTSGKKWRVLVENKIDAQFQPDQAGRYRRRADLYLKQQQCDGVVTLLIAPQKYLGDAANGFDRAVSYERLREWFEQSTELGDRKICKLGLLSAALEKCTAKEKNARITDFWKRYYCIVQELAPELSMPTPVPRSAGFVIFKPPATNEIAFLHKMNYGNIDLQFPGMGRHVLKLRADFSARLRPNMKIDRAHKSAVIRTVVAPLQIEGDFLAQESVVRSCVLEAKSVLQWWIANRLDWKRAADTTEELHPESMSL